MKCASVPSEYRNVILRDSVRIGRNFSPARNVRSITAPSSARLSLVRTNAPPLPGFTCWNSTILKTVPSTSTWVPFLNWLVLITDRRLAAVSQADARARRLSGHAPSRALVRAARPRRRLRPAPARLDGTQDACVHGLRGRGGARGDRSPRRPPPRVPRGAAGLWRLGRAALAVRLPAGSLGRRLSRTVPLARIPVPCRRRRARRLPLG